MKKYAAVLFLISLSAQASWLSKYNLDCVHRLTGPDGNSTRSYKGEVHMSTQENGPLYIKIRPFITSPLNISSYDLLVRSVKVDSSGAITGSKVTTGPENIYTSTLYLSRTAVGIANMRVSIHKNSSNFRATDRGNLTCNFASPIDLEVIYKDLEKNGFYQR